MNNFEKMIRDYGLYHKKIITKITHIIGVPLILFCILIFFSWFNLTFGTVYSINLSFLLALILSTYYIKVNVKYGLILTVIFIIFLRIIYLLQLNHFNSINLLIFVLIFVFGWIIQFTGHLFEKKKPAFLDNFMQIFSAPIFVVHEIFEFIKNLFK